MFKPHLISSTWPFDSIAKQSLFENLVFTLSWRRFRLVGRDQDSKSRNFPTSAHFQDFVRINPDQRPGGNEPERRVYSFGRWDFR
jgi:hypothetical protein